MGIQSKNHSENLHSPVQYIYWIWHILVTIFHYSFTFAIPPDHPQKSFDSAQLNGSQIGTVGYCDDYCNDDKKQNMELEQQTH